MNRLMPLLQLALPYRRILLVCMALLMIDTAVTVGIPWLAGRYAAGVLGLVATVDDLLIVLLLLLLLQSLLGFVTSVMLGSAAERIATDLRLRVYTHVQGLPLAYFHQHRRGDIEALLGWETAQVASFISGTLVAVVPQLLAVGGAVFMMLTLDLALGALVVVLIPAFVLILKMVGRRLRPLAAEVQGAYADTASMIDENLEMLPMIKAFNRERAEVALFRHKLERLLALCVRQLRLQSMLVPSLQFIAAAGVLVVLYLAGERIATATLQPEQLVTFILYAAMLTRPLGALAGVWGQLQSARGASRHLLEVMEEAAEPGNSDGLAGRRVRGELQFESVAFSYPARPPLFSALDLHVSAGETVAIVGENGSGKSTLVQLLLRLQIPHAGRITIDGHDIATFNLQFLRDQIALVSQQLLLFNGTVGANIAYSRPGATASDIMQAARLAQAHDFIMQLPQGYDTPVGDQGVRLSGGQRQRLALARALLKRAPIIVLDEASAMFDPAAEVAMLRDCRAVMRDATVLLITHRPASLALADRILCLRDGNLVPWHGDVTAVWCANQNLTQERA